MFRVEEEVSRRRMERSTGHRGIWELEEKERGGVSLVTDAQRRHEGGVKRGFGK